MNDYITVQVRNVYGNDLVYPMDDLAHSFVRLLGVKTFNRNQLLQIKQIGFEVRVAAGHLPWALS